MFKDNTCEAKKEAKVSEGDVCESLESFFGDRKARGNCQSVTQSICTSVSYKPGCHFAGNDFSGLCSFFFAEAV